MKSLITGGAGFIGSHLADLLLERGDHLVLVDNLYLGRLENIAHLRHDQRVRFVEQDLLDFAAIEQLFVEEGIERVYHLAANSDIARGNVQRDLDLKLNLETTRSVLEAMAVSGCKEIVFASTSAIYGETSELLHEDFGPLFPISYYGASKLAAEAYLSSYSNQFGFQVWITRFPNVVGERSTHGVIFDFINKLEKNPHELEVFGDGCQCKPYLYVKELVGAILHFTQVTNERVNYVNLGVESRTLVRDIAQMVIEEMGLKAQIRYTGGRTGWVGDVPEFRYSLEKINRLGWKPRLTSDEAVRTSIQKILESKG